MSGPADHMPDRDGMAAEYVLGTLPLPERLAAERLIASDTAFAALVTDWTRRLAPLNDAYSEVTPSADILPRIEARLFPDMPRPARWRLPFFGALAAGLAAVASVLIWPSLAPHDVRTVTLAGENQPLVVAANFDATAQELTFSRTAGPAADAGKDYELWVIPAGQKAISLGLLRDGDLRVALDALPAGTTLAVTLEPEGGAPGGVATGPILVATVIGES